MKNRSFSTGTLFVHMLIILLLLGCSSADEKKNAHFQKGIEYHEKGDTSAAILEFKNAVQIDPKFAEAYAELAFAYDNRAAIENIDNKFFKMHLMWSYRLGIFIGLLDDAIDLKEDLSNNKPNIFIKDNQVVQTMSAQSVAKVVAHKGVRIKQLWRKMILDHQHIDSMSEFLFPALIRSWIGDG